jgi:hypothetical protein
LNSSELVRGQGGTEQAKSNGDELSTHGVELVWTGEKERSSCVVIKGECTPDGILCGRGFLVIGDGISKKNESIE